MPTQRLFVALEIPEDIKTEISKIIQKIRPFDGVNWVEPRNLHLTLFFLGDQDETKVPDILYSLRDVSKEMKPFKIKLGGFDAFPNRREPKTSFVPVSAGSELLGSAVEKLSLSLQRRKILFDLKPFHGHVTLGRGKTLKGSSELVSELSASCPDLLGEMNVEQFVLFQSRLAKNGPIYTALEKFKFDS